MAGQEQVRLAGAVAAEEADVVRRGVLVEAGRVATVSSLTLLPATLKPFDGLDRRETGAPAAQRAGLVMSRAAISALTRVRRVSSGIQR